MKRTHAQSRTRPPGLSFSFGEDQAPARFPQADRPSSAPLLRPQPPLDARHAELIVLFQADLPHSHEPLIPTPLRFAASVAPTFASAWQPQAAIGSPRSAFAVPRHAPDRPAPSLPATEPRVYAPVEAPRTRGRKTWARDYTEPRQRLSQAMMSGDHAQVRELLQAHPPLLVVENEHGETPLQVACRSGNLRMVQCLLDHRSAEDVARLVLQRGRQHRCRPVLEAIAGGHTALVDYLLQRVPVPALLSGVDRHGNNALMTAVATGPREITQRLLAQPDAAQAMEKRDRHGRHALAIAASKPDVGILGLLLAMPGALALLSWRDREGRSPLEIAERHGRQEVIALIRAALNGQAQPAAPATGST